MTKPKNFDVRCPWCKKVNTRLDIQKSLYQTFVCWKCKREFFIDKEYETCKVLIKNKL